MNKITYEPIIDSFPFSYTVEDLRNVYLRLRPIFEREETPETEKIIQVQDE
jgi:hypothetical protein